MKTEELLQKLKVQESRAKKRSLILTLIPLVTAIILIIITSKAVIKAKSELNVVKAELSKTNHLNDSLKSQNDSLSNLLIESTVAFGKATSVFWNFKEMIDKIHPSDRTRFETRFFIEFRMLEEKVRGDYNFLSEKASQLPTITDENNWIVIVESNVSLDDLKKSAEKLKQLYGNDQVAIYKEGRNYYRLALKGNGTFTRAYRLNVELRDKHGYQGAYFDGIKDWGKNYLVN